MLDKENPYTTFGQLLVTIGILNMVSRIDIRLDVLISFIYLAKGGTLIRNKKLPGDRQWNLALSFVGMIYPIIKLLIIYFFLSDDIILNSPTTIAKADVMFSNSVFLLAYWHHVF